MDKKEKTIPLKTLTIKTSAINWVKSFVLPERMALIRVMLIAAIMTSFALAQPYLTKMLIDDGLLAKDMSMILQFSGILIIISLFVFILTGLNRWLYVALSGRILFNLREDVFSHLLKLSPYFYNHWRRGDILTRLDGDIAAVQRFATDSLLAVVNGALGLVGSFIIMVTLSWQLTIIAFLLLPLQILFLKFMRPKVEKTSKSLREKSSNLSSFFVEKISSVKFIQTFSGASKEEKKLSKLNQSYLKNLLYLQLINHVTSGIPAFLGIIATAMVFILGGYYVTEGTQTVGTLIAFTAYMGRATGPIQTFLGLYVAYTKAMVSLIRIKELKSWEASIKDPQNPVMIDPKAPRDLIFTQVSYFHDQAKKQGVKQINFTLKSGSRILISGPSGSGKSTLTDLIHRHFDPEQGSVTYAGQNLQDLSLKFLRGEIAIVDQNATYLKGSFWDNITYGVENPKKLQVNQVEEAAKTAQIHDYIMAQPQGYRCEIGEEGAALSGGQKQRISIARALLLKPKIIILDESTSAVDRENEQKIHGLLEENFNGTSLIIISHHLSEIGQIDQIYSMRDGILTEIKP
jgi:ATP-binding cassette subfamily B protein